jgi:hypothetical protein
MSAPAPLYRYRGDRGSRADVRGALCVAVRRADGRCVRGRNGNLLVRFVSTDTVAVVLGRQLRKVITP